MAGKYLIANSKGQSLKLHLLANYYFAKTVKARFARYFGIRESTFDSVPLALLFHDIGKAHSGFQKALIEDDPESAIAEFNKKFGRHEEISYSYLSVALSLSKTSIFEGPDVKDILWQVYWHHAKPSGLEPRAISTTSKEVSEVAKLTLELATLIKEDNLKLKPQKGALKTCAWPNYTVFEGESIDHAKSAFLQLGRFFFLQVDSFVSSLEVEELESCFAEGRVIPEVITSLSQRLFSSLKSESARSIIQDPTGLFVLGSKPALSLAQNSISEKVKNPGVHVISANAGFGKTLTAIKTQTVNQTNGMVIVCPRIAVIDSVFTELIAERQLYRLDESIIIEKRVSGGSEFYNNNGHLIDTPSGQSADITICTTDSICSMIREHSGSKRFLETIGKTWIFDEFHEWLDTPLQIHQLKIVLKMRSMMKNSKTLLMSGTPDSFLISQLELSGESAGGLDPENLNLYKLSFNGYGAAEDSNIHTPFTSSDMGTLKVSNNTKELRKTHLRNIDKDNVETVFVHSALIKSGKRLAFKKLLNRFSKTGKKDLGVRSGPLLKSSLNISFRRVVMPILMPNDFIQLALGRGNRFKEDYLCSLDVNIPLKDEFLATDIGEVLIKLSSESSKEFMKAYGMINSKCVELKLINNKSDGDERGALKAALRFLGKIYLKASVQGFQLTTSDVYEIYYAMMASDTIFKGFYSNYLNAILKAGGGENHEMRARPKRSRATTDEVNAGLVKAGLTWRESGFIVNAPVMLLHKDGLNNWLMSERNYLFSPKSGFGFSLNEMSENSLRDFGVDENEEATIKSINDDLRGSSTKAAFNLRKKLYHEDSLKGDRYPGRSSKKPYYLGLTSKDCEEFMEIQNNRHYVVIKNEVEVTHLGLMLDSDLRLIIDFLNFQKIQIKVA